MIAITYTADQEAARNRALALEDARDHVRRAIAACRASRNEERRIERCADLLRAQRKLEEALFELGEPT